MSQLNFFINDEELNDRLLGLISMKEVTLYAGCFFKDREPTAVKDLTQTDNFDRLVIWINNNFRPPVCSIDATGKFSGNFLFDIYYDPILEIEKCQFTDKLISPGRLYYKIGWIDVPELRLQHKKMAGKIRRIFNESLTNLSSPFKISPGVKRLQSLGFKVELGRGGRQI